MTVQQIRPTRRRRRRRPDHQLKPLWPGNVPPPHVAARLREFGIAPRPSLAQDVSLDADGLPAGGSAPVQGDPTPNPSHPVRSHIVAPTWRQVSDSAPARFCVCGMALPVKTGERCENCGRAIPKQVKGVSGE